MKCQACLRAAGSAGEGNTQSRGYEVREMLKIAITSSPMQMRRWPLSGTGIYYRAAAGTKIGEGARSDHHAGQRRKSLCTKNHADWFALQQPFCRFAIGIQWGAKVCPRRSASINRLRQGGRSFQIERLLEFVDPLGRFGLGQILGIGFRPVRLFRQGLQIGPLRAGHRLVAADPIVGVFLCVG